MMEDLLEYFSEVTGVDNERAKFHLDAAQWDLQVALANFYEPVDVATDSASDATIAGSTPNPLVTNEDTSEEQERGNGRNSNRESMSSSPPPQDTTQQPKQDDKSRKSKPRGNTNFATIHQYQNGDSSSDDEGQQAFYAGGSDRSGQQVLGPPTKKNDMVSDMFKSCKDQSVSVDTEDRPGHGRRPRTFGGTGYRLGQTNSDTEVLGGTGTSSSAGSTGISAGAQSNSGGLITLKLWRDGFTINDGEMRRYSDPGSREFLATIKRGEIPREIRQEFPNGEVRLDMEDHHHEEYIPTRPKVRAFTGKGHKLGSPSPATVGMTVTNDPADQAANESQARSSLNLDTSRPLTSLQIRLADGNNIREQFNMTHTIGDLRRFITTLRPQYALQDFVLLTSYPSRELTEEAQTIEEAGIQNSAIMQRLK